MRKLKVGDMFCGAGGTSHGLVNSRFAEIVWAINHDPKCIEAHKKNHPNTKHFEEDIVSMNIKKLTPVDLLWASLECTHFSQAKGGQSRDPDSRMLARQMYRYIRQTDPLFIVIENVKEFLSWGPLTERRDKRGEIVYQKKKGKVVLDEKGNPKPILVPIKERKGEFYKDWVSTIKAMGYEYEYQMINSADHGARTSRTRYFGIFVKKGYTISFPKATHSKDGVNGLRKWLPCRDLINLEDEGTSIFGREYNKDLPKHLRRPLAENTIKRIVAGVKKFCLDGELLYDHNFISKYYGTGENCSSLEEPLHTVTTKDRHMLISVEKENFVTEHFGTTRSVDKPMPTIMAYKDQKYLVTMKKARFTTQNYTAARKGNERVDSLKLPLKTIPTANIHSLVTLEKMQFVQHYFNSTNNPGANTHSVDSPMWSMTTERKEGLVTLQTKFNYLIDIKTRFLTADELKQIQGFDSNYELIGSQATQKKAIGNSVVPLVAQRIIEELWTANEYLLMAA